MDPLVKSRQSPEVVGVCGHETAFATLVSALASGRAPHATLLVGPPGVGRAALARRLAQWLFCCAAGPSRPCGDCRACRLVASGVHPDLLLLEAPVKVEAVRELQRRLALAPLEAGSHLAIVPDIDRATAAAANSLLKTLEEPPPGAFLVLTATDPAGVLPTVLSRCQSVSLRPLPVAAAAAALERQHGLDPAAADLLARLSGGRLAWAARAAADPAFLESRELWLDRMEQALAADPAGRLRCADAWSRQRDELRIGMEIWLGWWRDVLLIQHRQERGVANVDRAEALGRAAAAYTVTSTVRTIRALREAAYRLRGGASVDLTTSVVLLELPS